MFTGIITDFGVLKELREGLALIETPFKDFQMGESISVNGICLTVDGFKDSTFSCHLSPETLKRTTAPTWNKNRPLHLEKALKVGDALGGHWVQGHIDTVGELTGKKPHSGGLELHFGWDYQARPDYGNYLIEKGSITVDGVSLTLNTVSATSFSVMIIPHTLEQTHLGQLQVGEGVNLEFDYLVKIVTTQIQKTKVTSHA